MNGLKEIILVRVNIANNFFTVFTITTEKEKGNIMQINSVNNQNSFGLKFSPRFKNALREMAIEVFSKDGNEAFSQKYTPKVRDIFEQRVQKLKSMMPESKIDIVDMWTCKESRIMGLPTFMHSDFSDFPSVQNIPFFYKGVILKREGMPDMLLNKNFDLHFPSDLQRVIKNLERIKREEKQPILKAAIERTKKLLP